VPPTPIDQDRIPGIQIGSPTEDVTPAPPGDARAASRRRDRSPGSDVHGGGDSGGPALPIAGGGSGRDTVAGPRSGDGAPGQPVSGTDPAGGSGDSPGPAPGDDDRDGEDRRGPGTGVGSGDGNDDEAAPRQRTAPVPAPAPPAAQAGDEPAADEADDGPTSASTRAAPREDDGVEVEGVPAPAAAIPAPTLDYSHDSDDE
jgi:hypothetical protein